MSKPLHIHPICIGTEDIVDMALIQFVLVLVLAVSQLSFRILAGSINEKDIAGGTIFLKHQNTCRDRSAIEQIGGQTDNSIQQIFLNDSLADTAFRRASKQNLEVEHAGKETDFRIYSFNRKLWSSRWSGNSICCIFTGDRKSVV